MSDRESAHQLIDTLPEDQVADALDHLAELQDTTEISAAIAEGLDDIRNGRTISLDEYRRTRGL